MANVKYFSDHNGETVQLKNIIGMENAEFEARFPGIKGKRWDGFKRIVGEAVDSIAIWNIERHAFDRDTRPATRAIAYKSNPSLHKCDSRCLNAKGGNCECACGGENHGKGFRAEAV
jgi:hypothetical protein